MYFKIFAILSAKLKKVELLIMKSFFITLEGVDGAGKTTQIELLRQIPLAQNWLFTRNPGGTSFGQKLREILLNDRTCQLHEMAELFLYMADRAQHIHEIIQPALRNGQIVICDRFIDSTLAYQGYGRGLNTELIKQLNKIATSDLKPDLTILFDINPKIGLERAKSKDKIEEEGLDFQQKIRLGFLQLVSEEPERFVIIDTEKNNIQEAHQKVIESIFKLIN